MSIDDHNLNPVFDHFTPELRRSRLKVSNNVSPPLLPSDPRNQCNNVEYYAFKAYLRCHQVRVTGRHHGHCPRDRKSPTRKLHTTHARFTQGRTQYRHAAFACRPQLAAADSQAMCELMACNSILSDSCNQSRHPAIIVCT